ncbi:MAG: CapA family protein [Ruminococcaceae bacterium]|nr:CapA family protein [Oscillospiraceae bacterium]
MKRNEIKLISILLVLILAVFGGTAQMRPERSIPSVSAPSASLPSQSQQGTQQSEDPENPGESQQPPVQETPAPQSEFFTINMIGDCTLASVSYYQGTAQGYDTVINGDWAYPFSLTAELFADDDMTFANLECSLTDSDNRTDKTFTFKCDPEYANIMVEGNVEFVTLANNHVLDYGEGGYKDTKEALDAVGIAYAGRDEYAVYETESGLKIGVYALSFGNTSQIKAGMTALKALEPDFIIAAMHWGDEGSYTVNNEQIKLAHACIDEGADFVYGSHPHTLQPYEVYKDKYIYYSMGNWTFGGNTDPRDNDTFILRLTLEKTPDGKVSVVDREHIPAACSGIEKGNDYRPVLYEEGSEEYKRVLSKLDGSFTGQNLSIGYEYTSNE